MKPLSTAIVAVLLALLGALGAMQYVWLGQISSGEQARLQKRLETDTARFAEDFNREIQSAYSNFQLGGEAVREKNYAQFAERVNFWRAKSAYPNLVKDFYFIDVEKTAPVLVYDADKRSFIESESNDAIEKLRRKLSSEDDFAPLDEDALAFLAPIHADDKKRIERIIIRGDRVPAFDSAPILTAKKIGYLVTVLDAPTIENKILPDLVKKYFFEGESADYKLFVKENRSGKTIFQTDDTVSGDAADATAGMLSVSPDNLAFFINRNVASSVETDAREKTRKSGVFVTRSYERREYDSSDVPKTKERKAFNVEVEKNANQSLPPRVRVFDRQTSDGAWTLTARHASGSLAQFVTNARRKNLAASFGILSLLGLSALLVFVSAQRARVYAQRQIDFVSSVSHEFRTPLAVIRSAGENLIDGVVKDEAQIARYGDLIRREGVKLSQMVEQILEFAGARSGKRRFDLRETEIKSIVENAVAECHSLIDEKHFTVEYDIAENLPEIAADANALSQAVQNLIVNAVKYSNGNRWLKISAMNGGSKIKIVVEDKGIGIAPPDLKHIFEPFYRSKSVVDEQIHGNGLGLSLVKQTVEAHGGKVAVESQIGTGSRFVIEIPGK